MIFLKWSKFFQRLSIHALGARPSPFFVLSMIVGLSAVSLATGQEISDPVWRYTTEKPSPEWSQVTFNDRAWKLGAGGFGTKSTPGSRVGTEWSSSNIWIRRSVELSPIPKNPALYIHHDEDAEVFINGELVATFERWVSEYQVVPLEGKARESLRDGINVVAVHCSQTSGGQFIDVHLIDADNVPRLPLPPRPEKPFVTGLVTPWGEGVTDTNVWQEYPRPGLVRSQWQNLNGNWDYVITKKTQVETPGDWQGKILVPFSLESRLSGVQKLLDPDEALWYRTTFESNPKDDDRTLLNFEAVDYRAQVWVNGKHVGGHVGGNVPFSLDVTDAVKSGGNELVVRVEDATEGFQLNGKQTLNPRGIWYTQVSGIWQTVWLEQVPGAYVSEIDVVTEASVGRIVVTADIQGDRTHFARWQCTVLDGDSEVVTGESTGSTIDLVVPNAKLWSPTQPHLYQLRITTFDDQQSTIETVHSYAGIRDVGKMQDEQGKWRFTLNGSPIFHWGPLDQGWWPDGLLTPPADAAMIYEIEFLKRAGFNMIRKHIKVEPRRYYYHCDRLGMMVWQDQVSGGANPPWTRMAPNPKDAQWPDSDHTQFMQEFEEMVDQLEFHPSIVVWVPFNEAWGQHRTVEVGEWIVRRDPSRLVNIASGGNYWSVGDIADHHSYPHPEFPLGDERFKDSVCVVGEFGGHGLPIQGHLYDASRDNWGYGGLPKDAAEYKDRYRESLRRLNDLKRQGIAGAVYTQTTDVEGEINGLMTYDRRRVKIPAVELKKLSAPLVEQ